TLTLGAIGGTGSLTKQGSGNLSLASVSTFSGDATITAGSLVLNSIANTVTSGTLASGALGTGTVHLGSGTNSPTLRGNGSIAGDVLVDTAGTLSLTASNQIADTSTVTVNAGGAFSVGSKIETIGNLVVGSGFTGNAVTGGNGTLTIATSGTATINSGGVTVT